MAHKHARIRLYGDTYYCDVVTDKSGEKLLHVFDQKKDYPFIQPDHQILSANIRGDTVEVRYSNYVPIAVLHVLVGKIAEVLEPGLRIVAFVPFEVTKLHYSVPFDPATGILKFAGDEYECEIFKNGAESWLDIRIPGIPSLEIARGKIFADTLTVIWKNRLPLRPLQSILNVVVNQMRINVRAICLIPLWFPRSAVPKSLPPA